MREAFGVHEKTVYGVVGGIAKDLALAADIRSGAESVSLIEAHVFAIEGGRVDAADDPGNQRLAIVFPDGRVLIARVAADHEGWYVERVDGEPDHP